MKTKQIKNEYGDRFELTATRIQERWPTTGDGVVDDVRRFVLRSAIHKALRGNGKSVRLQHPSGAFGNYSIDVDKYSDTHVDIGCQTFTGDNAEVIIKWAKSYRKPAKKNQTVAKVRAAAAGKAKRKK